MSFVSIPDSYLMRAKFFLCLNMIGLAWALAACVPQRSTTVAAGETLSDVHLAKTSYGSTTTIEPRLTNGKCLDVYQNGSAEGTRVVQWSCNGQDNQKWNLERVGGDYKVISVASGKCLGVTSSQDLSIATCTDQSSQKFRLTEMETSTFQFVNIQNNECMDVYANSTADGASIVHWSCNGGLNQLFRVKLAVDPQPTPVPTPAPTPAPQPSGFGSIQPNHVSGKCLDVSSNGTGDGTPVIQYACHGGANQQWSFAARGSGYQIASQQSGKCLSQDGSSVLVIQSCNGSDAQLFKVNEVEPGKAALSSLSNGKCVDVYSASGDNFAKVGFWGCNGGKNQIFSIPKVGSSPQPTPIDDTPGPIRGKNYSRSFFESFSTLGTISLGDTYNGSTWYNGVKQCCMVDSNGLPAVMFPTSYNGIQVNPYSLITGGGLNIDLVKKNNVWYSGILTSVDRNQIGFTQQYGYFEMVAKMPEGDGVWPAFWMLSTRSDMPAEIDMMEYYGHDKGTTFGITLHDWRNGGTDFPNRSFFPKVSGMTSGYHAYGMLWDEQTMIFYYDDKEVWRRATPDIMKQPFYILVNNGLGGYWPTDNTPAFSQMQIKSIRAFKK